MARSRALYPPDFREQIVALARGDRSIAELARKFEPTQQMIRNWLVQADREEGKRADIFSSTERRVSGIVACYPNDNRW